MDDPPGNHSLLNFFSDQTLLYIIMTAAFILLSSWASAVEAAFFSLQPDDMVRLQSSSERKERSIAQLLKEPRLLLHVLTSFKYGALMAICALTVSTFFSTDGNESTVQVPFGATVLVLTVLFALAGVILSKIIGAQSNLSIAKNNSIVIERLMIFLRPIFRPLLWTSINVERKLNSKTEEKAVEEITQALQLAAVDNEPIEGEKEILEGIVNFTTTTVRQVMKARNDISHTDVSLNFHELLDFIKKSGFSRVPVSRGSLNAVEGVLYIKDILPFLNESKDFHWQKLLRPGYFTRETKKIDVLLKEFQEKRVHMALVVNQQKQTIGLITLEDIIEELIGDINDEFDEPGSRYQRINESNYLFDGKTSIHEFCRILNVDDAIFQPVKGINESLNGILIEINGSLPAVGEKITVGGLLFIVEAVDHKKIKKVRVQIHA